MGSKVFQHYYDSLACAMRDIDVSSKWIQGEKVLFDPQTGELTVPHDKQKIRQEGPFLISREDGRLHLCFSQEEEIKVPEGVRSIASGAFTKELCPNLKHLILLPLEVDVKLWDEHDCGCYTSANHRGVLSLGREGRWRSE